MQALLKHATCIALLFCAVAVHAIDCKKASNRVEHMICADARLKAADAEMGKAYAAIQQQAGNDAELHAMLVRSQKRWIAARDKDFDAPMDFPNAPDAKALSPNLLQEIRWRTRKLSEPGKTSRVMPRLLETALEQRKFLAQFTGGTFAGFDIRCSFLPGNQQQSYACMGESRTQHQNRVCMLRYDWASGRYYQTRLVGNVVEGRLETAATCGDGSGGDTLCPDLSYTGGPEARWNLNPGLPAESPAALPKLDAETMFDVDDTGWLRTCLTDSRYPQDAKANAAR